MMTEQVAEARESLESILHGPSGRVVAALERWGTSPPHGDFVVGGGTAYDGSAAFVLWDSMDAPASRYPYRAQLRFVNGRWVLHSILGQCLGCFGSGILPDDETPCPVCLARGWGLVGSEDFEIAAPIAEDSPASTPGGVAGKAKGAKSAAAPTRGNRQAPSFALVPSDDRRPDRN